MRAKVPAGLCFGGDAECGVVRMSAWVARFVCVVGLGLVLTAGWGCSLPSRPKPTEHRLEEQAGMSVARGLVPLTTEKPIPVRLHISDAIYAFYVVPGPRLAAWAAQQGAQLDVERGAIVRPGAPPVLLANARDLSRLLPGPQNAWLFSTSLDTWVPLHADEIAPTPIPRESIAELEPGLPWHTLRLELDEDSAGVEVDVNVGGAYWRYLTHDLDNTGQVRFLFEASPAALGNDGRRARGREAVLRTLAALPREQLLLENLHGLNLDLGPPLSPSLAARWFEEIARLREVPWELIDDGCGERAMIASMHLARRGVRSLKVFVVGDLRVPAATEPVEWSFHVAPGVMVEERGRVELRIFDPSLAKQPLSLPDWLSRFVNGPIVVDVLPWYQRNAVEWGGFEREEDAETHLSNAREALEEVVAEWHQERATRALEEAAAVRSEKVGGERPIVSY